VVLADGEADGLAEEGALAFKEISQLPSNYYHLLDARHGPMVLFGARTLVLAALRTPVDARERALIADIVARGAAVVCFSNLPCDIPGAECFALGEDVGAAAGGLGLLALCQLASLYKSAHTGCNPDLPDGLSPWISIG